METIKVYLADMTTDELLDALASIVTVDELLNAGGFSNEQTQLALDTLSNLIREEENRRED